MISMNYTSEALLFTLQQQNVVIAIRSLQLCFDVEGWVTNITRAIGLASCQQGKQGPIIGTLSLPALVYTSVALIHYWSYPH